MLNMIRMGVQKKMMESRVQNNASHDEAIIGVCDIAARSTKVVPEYKFEKIMKKYKNKEFRRNTLDNTRVLATGSFRKET